MSHSVSVLVRTLNEAPQISVGRWVNSAAFAVQGRGVSRRDPLEHIYIKCMVRDQLLQPGVSPSSALRGLASLAFMAPYCGSHRYQVEFPTWRLRHTSSWPAPSAKSLMPAANLQTTPRVSARAHQQSAHIPPLTGAFAPNSLNSLFGLGRRDEAIASLRAERRWSGALSESLRWALINLRQRRTLSWAAASIAAALPEPGSFSPHPLWFHVE